MVLHLERRMIQNLELSVSELLYDWSFTANQFFLAPTPWDPRPVSFFSAKHLRL
jgi:hypothetical protein